MHYRKIMHTLECPSSQSERSIQQCWLTESRGISLIWQKKNIFTALITVRWLPVYNSNKAPQGFVVYGQYTTANDCIQANPFCVTPKNSPYPWYIGHISPPVPYYLNRVSTGHSGVGTHTLVTYHNGVSTCYVQYCMVWNPGRDKNSRQIAAKSTGERVSDATETAALRVVLADWQTFRTGTDRDYSEKNVKHFLIILDVMSRIPLELSSRTPVPYSHWLVLV